MNEWEASLLFLLIKLRDSQAQRLSELLGQLHTEPWFVLYARVKTFTGIETFFSCREHWR